MAAEPHDCNQYRTRSRVQNRTRGDSSSYCGLAEFDRILERHDLREALRVCAWIVKFIHNSRQVLWKRWACEYVPTLGERHNCKGDGSPKTLWIGDVVILGGDESNRGKWPMGVVVHLFMVEMESCEKSNSLQGNLSFR